MYDIKKANQLIYYNLENLIKDVPDECDYIKISVNHINDKRRLDIDIVKGYMYSYRIYLDDYFYMGLFNIIDGVFGGGFSVNSNCLYGNVSREGQKMKDLKYRLTELTKFKLPVDFADYANDMLEILGWEKGEFKGLPTKKTTKTTKRKKV